MNEQLQSSVSKYTTYVMLQETTDNTYCYVASHRELPTVLSQGDTVEEALGNLAEATQLAIDHLVHHGLPIPEPTPVGVSARSDVHIGSSKIRDDAQASVSIQPVYCA